MERERYVDEARDGVPTALACGGCGRSDVTSRGWCIHCCPEAHAVARAYEAAFVAYHEETGRWPLEEWYVFEAWLIQHPPAWPASGASGGRGA